MPVLNRERYLVRSTVTKTTCLPSHSSGPATPYPIRTEPDQPRSLRVALNSFWSTLAEPYSCAWVVPVAVQANSVLCC